MITPNQINFLPLSLTNQPPLTMPLPTTDFLKIKNSPFHPHTSSTMINPSMIPLNICPPIKFPQTFPPTLHLANLPPAPRPSPHPSSHMYFHCGTVAGQGGSSAVVIAVVVCVLLLLLLVGLLYCLSKNNKLSCSKKDTKEV